MEGVVFIVELTKAQRESLGIYASSVTVATFTKSFEKESALRVWARGEQDRVRPLDDVERKMYLYSAFYRGLDYIMDRQTPATFSGSWVLPSWDGVKVIGRITAHSDDGVRNTIRYTDE
jgi:hypothetical protein